MSFILNALRKSEKERLALQAKSSNVDLSLIPTQHKRRQVVIYGLIFIAINVFLTLAMIWFIRESDVSSQVEAKIITKPNIQIESMNKIGPSEVIINSAKTEKIYKEDKKQIKSTSFEDLLKQEDGSFSRSLVHSPPLIKPAVQEVKPIEHEIIKPSEPLIVKEKIFVPDASESNLPFLQDLPFEYQQSVPKIVINVFVYSEQTDDCFVMIDGVKYKVGQTLPSGLYIKDMTANSLVVLFQSKVFQIERP
ncbi:MAG: general secretion pathway protein GspB [Methylococcales bacterium]|nr:general secretion pathway protein GspB [Methylococcales bacterium]